MKSKTDILIAWLKCFDRNENDHRTARQCALEMERLQSEVGRWQDAWDDVRERVVFLTTSGDWLPSDVGNLHAAFEDLRPGSTGDSDG